MRRVYQMRVIAVAVVGRLRLEKPAPRTHEREVYNSKGKQLMRAGVRNER